MVLVKWVLQAIPLYLFSVLAALKHILKKIRNIQRNFLWGGSNTHHKSALVDWKTICKPKAARGLGFRELISVNNAMGAKIWWRWITHSSEPWAITWHCKYAPQWTK